MSNYGGTVVLEANAIIRPADLIGGDEDEFAAWLTRTADNPDVVAAYISTHSDEYRIGTWEEYVVIRYDSASVRVKGRELMRMLADAVEADGHIEWVRRYDTNEIGDIETRAEL